MPDPQVDRHDDEEASRRAAEAILADPRHDHPTRPNKPIAVDEEAHAAPPPWADDDGHAGPLGWHREVDPDGSGFVWVED